MDRVQKRASNVMKLTEQNEKLKEELRAMTERLEAAERLSYAGPERLVAEGRPVALKRAVANLVSNALSYGGAARLRLSAPDAQGNGVRLSVEDDGPGIPPENREDVFRPFVRLDQARNQDEGGTGLGLSIARDIARSHGGDIILGDSVLGGLRATVRVPV